MFTLSKYISKNGQWVTPEETSGSIQNTSSNVTIEVTANAEENQGLILAPMQIVNFEGTIYVKSSSDRDASFTVVPFKVSAGGGGGGGGTPYTLPTASAEIKGGIKIGAGLKMDDETLSVDGTGIESFATGTEYEVGDIVLFNNILYRAIRAHTSTTFASDTANWELVYSSIPLWTASTHYHVGDVVINNNKVYRCKESHNATASFTIYYWDLVGERTTLKEWTAFTEYEVGEMVYYDGVIYVVGTAHRSSTIFTASNFYLLNASIENYVEDRYYPKDVVVTISGELYRCNTAHTGGFEPNFSRFTRITGRITPWLEGRLYRVNEVVSYNDVLYICNTQHTATNSFSADIANWTPVKSSIKLWASTTEYLVGENVIYDNTLYTCNTAHTSGSAFDLTKFNFVKVLLSADTNNTLEYKNDGLYQEDPEGLTAAEIKAIVDDFEPELPNDTALVIASAPAFYQREQLFTSAKTTLTVYPTWINICGTGYILTDEHVIDLTVEASWDDNQYITASNRAGKDFYIYACHPALVSPTPVFKLSASKIVPSGYTSANSRLIGGFHCECEDVGTIAGHALSGYVAGDIIPNSVWDLDFRAVSDNDGMAYVDSANLWFDIYLPSWDGNKLVSKYYEEPVTGVSEKAMHALLFSEEFGKVGKRLPTTMEFTNSAMGTQPITVINTEAPPEYTGGHYNNEGQRIISNYGLEDCCGVLWQWTSTFSEFSTTYRWNPNTIYDSSIDSEILGSCYGWSRHVLIGGCYDVVANGPRIISCVNYSAKPDARFSARGISEVRRANR